MAREIFIAWLPFLVSASIWVVIFAWSLKRVPELPSLLTGPTNSITLARPKQYSAFVRQFTVVIDGADVGHIGAGEVKHFPVNDGPHTIAVSIDWCTSAPSHVEKRPNQALVMQCGVKSNLAAFYRPSQYAYIRIDG
jgi:hypothetical protein